MIAWRGTGDDSVGLAVTGYEFPQIADGHDGNWLTISAAVRNPTGSWTAKSSCLLTWDLVSLIDFLYDLEAGSADTWVCLDMDLTIKSLGRSRGKEWLALTLSCGLRNPALPAGEDARDLVIVGCTPEELATSRAAVERAAKTFPARGVQGQRGIAAVRSRVRRSPSL